LRADPKRVEEHGMAARRGSGLSAEQVGQLRTEVESGRRKRVVVSGPQFPDGMTGTVVRVGEPGVDGDDFVAVRVKVGGVIDELGFAPSELSLVGRGRTAKATSAAASRPADPAPSPPKVAAKKSRPAAAKPAPKATPEPETEPAPKPAKRGHRPTRRAASAAPVTITIASSGVAWTVSAQRGQRAVVKKAAVSPGVVAAVAALLGQPLVEEGVAAVNDTARLEAEARAEELRAELAQVEAVLHSHRRP
jgi:hypothetical protein